MFSTLIIVAIIVTAAIWIYDVFALLPKRLKNQEGDPKHMPYVRGIFLFAVFVLFVKVLNINILTLLVILTIASGIVWLLDIKFFRAKREATGRKENFIIDYSRSLFWIFFAVLIIRAFIGQLFSVPTGSLEPTVMPGDVLVVSQFSYGLRLPITGTKILNVGEPKLGDIAVFHYPVNPSIDYIKRIVGLPGDHIVYKNKTLYINGKKMPQTFVKNTFDFEPGDNIPAKLMQEDLNGKKHELIVWQHGGETTSYSITVPKGYYLAMGDNRDDSYDSRYWGLVPEKNLVGKAEFVLINLHNGIHFNRTGKRF